MNEQEAIDKIKAETMGSMEVAYWIVVAYKAQKEASLARHHADVAMSDRATEVLTRSRSEDE